MRLCTIAALVATLTIGATGCGSDGSDSDSSAVDTVAVAAVVAVDEFPEGVYRADVVNPPYAMGQTLASTMTFADGVWTQHDDSGEPDCLGTYAVDAGRIQITTSTDKTHDCGNPVGHVFYESSWRLNDGVLRFLDIDSDAGAVYTFGNQPWTKTD